MEKLSLRQTILEILDKHLNQDNGILLGECVSDPGGVEGTIPVSKNVIDTPMSEVAGPDFAVGCAIVGRRPVYVVRFQDFMLMGQSPFIAWAAPYKEMTGIPCPVFIRGMACDYFNVTHSNLLHSTFMHFPGINVYAPMTPGEYREAWKLFMSDDKPMYVSEYRDALDATDEMTDEIHDDAVLNVFAISKARQNSVIAKSILEKEGIKINLFHIAKLKPLEINKYKPYLEKCQKGLVIDAGRTICGAPEHIAHELMDLVPSCRVFAYGTADKFKSCNPNYYNEVPNAELIVKKIKDVLKKEIL